MKDDVLTLLLQTEKEYHSAMRAAVENAEKYIDESRKEQQVYIAEMKRDFDSFEKAETERLEQALALECGNMEQEAERRKARMRALKEEHTEKISQRLKEEVLALLWQ